MAVQTSYPGVYVQEVPSGVRTIMGVSTSIALFVGSSQKGPIDQPVRCSNYTLFKNKFGEGGTSQMPLYLKLFFQNGGSDCYVLRIANGAKAAAVTLKSEASVDVLVLTAKDEGVNGENIRAAVTYGGLQPEATFNIDIFIWDTDSSGRRTKTQRESWKNISMNPTSATYAPTYLSQNSALINASLPAAALPAAIQGFSQSGRPLQLAGGAGTDFRTTWKDFMGSTSINGNRISISVDGSPYHEMDIIDPTVNVSTMAAGSLAAIMGSLITAIQNAITTGFSANGISGVTVKATFPSGPTAIAPNIATSLLNIASTTNGDVFIRPAAINDVATALMLGTAQGGIEVAATSVQRPAPNGLTFRGSDLNLWNSFAGLLQNTFTPPPLPAPPVNGIQLEQWLPAPATGTTTALVNFAKNLETVAAPSFFYQDGYGAGSKNGNNDGIREKLAIMVNGINAYAASNPLFKWSASLAGARLSIVPTDSVDDNFLSGGFASPGFPANTFLNNAKAYSVGSRGLGIGGKQSVLMTGNDGSLPQPADYDTAYASVVDQQVDLFNLLVLPPDDDPTATSVFNLYNSASVYCQQRRAFLLMDPPATWTDAQTASTAVASLRIGLVKDYSAVYFPQINITDNQRFTRNIGPSGAMAGLYARIDSTRGVWKSAAGTEADLRTVNGVKQLFSDADSGYLNPRAVNAVRLFPSIGSVVSWGARTNDGDDDAQSEYKYVAVRRTALFIEESLYRGLKWVVFEPNDEPLWAQIRLNAGAFMNNLFRQGAFQGTKPSDAYFVKCDNETTTQNDIDLGIVNIWVGFAPLKPAEFVVLSIQQIAGNILT